MENSLEPRLAQARERLMHDAYMGMDPIVCRHEGFDACAAIAREVVAEKDRLIEEMAAKIDELSGDKIAK